MTGSLDQAAQHQASRLLPALVMLTAAVVTGLRFFTPTDLGYDLTLQIQAGQHLVAGKGLSVYWPTPTDLSQPLALRPLTHFSAGFSLVTALGLALGLPVALVVKLYGASCTLVGWLGWGRFSGACVGPLLGRARFWRAAVVALTLTLPLFLTPDWNGTDIFLWAAVPWVLEWLARAGSAPSWPGVARWDGLAGALCGLCISMRYASLVLVGYAGLILLLQSWRRPGVLVGRWLVFGLTAAPLVLLQAHLLFSAPGRAATPGGIDASRGSGAVVAGVVRGAKLLPSANYPLISWAPERCVRLVTAPGDRAPWLYAVAAASWMLPWLVAKRSGAASLSAALADRRFVAAGFAVVLPLFLWVCTALGDYPVLANRRYYLPLIPLAPMLVWYLGSPWGGGAVWWRRWVETGARLFAFGFLTMAVVGVVFAFVPGAHGRVQRAKLMADADLRCLLKSGLDYDSLPARQYVLDRLRAEPDRVLLTNFEQWFYADPSVDRSRIQRVESCESMSRWTVSGPARFLILACDIGGPNDIGWVSTEGQIQVADCLAVLPGVRLVKRFPEQQAKVLECEIPAGVRLGLGGAAANSTKP